MAPIAGLLIEYLVVGAVAGIWGIPFALTELEAHPDFPIDSALPLVALLVPGLYLLGMVCDLVGYKLTHPFKVLIESKVAEKNGEKNLGSQFVHAFAVMHEPGLAK